jgi:glycosyltransferase involved in cell wall biosynthesis
MTKQLPRISIITPSYNQASYLEETLLSVFSQEYPDLEYMVVDGGSTDGSVEIIEKYADRLAWWVSAKDNGQADALNKGFARATGEIVAWINSDDYYLPGAFAAAVRALEENPDCGMVYGDVVSINGAGERINVMRYGDWGLDELLQFNIIGQPSVFMRRSVLEQAGYLDLSYHYLLDHELWLRVAQKAPVRYFPQCWSAARFHAEAKNLAHAAKYGRDAYRVVEWIKTQPALAENYRRNQRKIWAGAHRINARYLLDGNMPGPSLKAYLQSLLAYPPAALPEFHRMLFAAASMVVNVDSLRTRYLERRKRKINARAES